MRAQNVMVPLAMALHGHVAVALPTFGAMGSAMGNAMGSAVDSVLAPLAPLIGGGSSGSSGLAAAAPGAPSSQQIDAAARAWRNDTGTVSKFLSTASSMDPEELQRQGKIALDAENDELIHKAVLDKVFLNGTTASRDAGVADANDVLVNQSTFQFIVDGLTLLSNRGASMKPDEVETLVRAMNQEPLPARAARHRQVHGCCAERRRGRRQVAQGLASD